MKYLNDKKEDLSLKYILTLLLGAFLPIFTFCIFAPTEIFFANYEDLGLIYSDFGDGLWKYGILATVIVTVILVLLPRRIARWILSAVWIFTLCGYVQTMFLNGNMDRIGESTFGYQPTTQIVLKDFALWALVIAIAIVLLVVTGKNRMKLILLTSVILIATQAVAYVSLFASADEKAFEVNTEGELCLDGSQRFEVSDDENVIVIVLDSVANFMYDEWMLAKYPEAESILKDFTYYNNAESLDYGTFPSAMHLITGYSFDPTSGVNEYFKNAWENEATADFYQDIHDLGYKVKLYEYADYTFTGAWGLDLLEGKVDNIRNDTAIREVNYEASYGTLLKMSCYRFLPDYFKPKFNVSNETYASLVKYPENVIEWANPDFMDNLEENGGLTTTGAYKDLTFYFLDGVHEVINDENCERIEAVDADQESVSNALRGCWKLLETYFDDLKEVGAYDKSTIIICADHGVPYNNQPIFFIKEKGVSKDAITINTAPITWDNVLPTMAENMGLTGGDYGETVYDVREDEVRTRTVGIRASDPDYPTVDCYNGMEDVDNLVYHIYTYTGDRMAWRQVHEADEYETVPATEAFYW